MSGTMRVAVTRAPGQSRVLEDRLRALGLRVLRVPVIRIAPPADPRALLRALRSPYDLAVLASPNAARAFRRAGGKGPTVGPGPSKALLGRMARRGVRGSRILIPRSDVAPPDLPRALRRLGAKVRSVTAYRTVPVPLPEHSAAALAGCDLVTFASASAAASVAASLRRHGIDRKSVRAVSIGPETSRALRRRGLNVVAEARPSSLDGLVRAVRKALKGAAA